MIDAACARFDIDLSQSWVVGDRDVDAQMAGAVGARGILVRTGHGERDLRHHSGHLPEGTIIAMDLMDAVTTILASPSEAP
jgi:D-glycero-D-manno-heptose 1,7-bisphosphate phosphatase